MAPAHSITDLTKPGSPRRVASRRKLYEAMNSGALKAHKNGKRTVILDEDLRVWLAGLPTYQPRKAA